MYVLLCMIFNIMTTLASTATMLSCGALVWTDKKLLNTHYRVHASQSSGLVKWGCSSATEAQICKL